MKEETTIYKKSTKATGFYEDKLLLDTDRCKADTKKQAILR